ncbi:hypothetical protein [Mariniflexile maritimum]|uniref:hypothetical protein n=1 Tax=Mariniflexile maritimum TaxID=2682493 RepID=UPI0012F67DA9|nr:hypothetical protein [Mariniflexile maritimum]MCB0449531.1 hypothetical protein [Confluentibacter sp.]
MEIYRLYICFTKGTVFFRYGAIHPLVNNMQEAGNAISSSKNQLKHYNLFAFV